MLLRFPSYDSIVSGKYFVNVRCDALMQNNENKSFEKTIWLYY
jgi:hypothetical protein